MPQPADFVFQGGPVFRSDAPRSWATAVAVRAGSIVGVGGEADVAPLVGAATQLIDLEGRFLTAGFQDAHVHPISAGLTLLRCNLLDTANLDAALEAISTYASAASSETWIIGGGWRFHWFDRGMPSAELLDRLVPDRPAYLRVADGHAGWANSRALDAAGIDETTPDPADGRIERLPDGTPQGTLQEGAMNLVERALPDIGDAQLSRGLTAGQDYLLALGVTAWQDAWVTEPFHRTYVAAARDGSLTATVRGAMWWDHDAGLEQLDVFEEMRRESLGRYQAGTVKLMLDGVCENYTARMLEPYLDVDGAPTSNTGIDFLDPTELPTIVTEVVRRGFQPHFHALGDAAVRSALDAVEAARSDVGWTDVRPHIAHIQVIDPDDLPRFRSLGVTANAQPLWACADEAMTEMTIPFLGEARARLQYPFNDLLRHGATLAMGSDWSVTSPDVLEQIDVAVHRRVLGGSNRDAFLPEQRITIADAIAAFTAGSAYVNHLDATHGSIEVGKAADLVVLDGNPFTSADIASVGVDLTMVDGKIAYQRDVTPGCATGTIAIMTSFWHPFANMADVADASLEIERGEGVYVFDTAGKRYLDGTASLWYSNIGYGRTEIADAVAAQMTKLHAFHTFGDYTNRPAEELSSRIAAIAPVPGSKVFLTSGGSDSVDTAAKLARRYFAATGEPERTVFITREWAYHGMHGYGTSLAGMAPNKEGTGPLVEQVVKIPFDSIDALTDAVAEIGPERLAGFYAEPVIGAGGVRPVPEVYLKEARAIVRDSGALYISDEVVTGFGRCGDWFASSRFSLEPDLVTFAKGVTSGYAPLGGVIASPRVAEPFWSGDGTMWRHGYTYSGHPSACVAGIVNLDIIEREGLLARALELETELMEALEPLIDHPLVSHLHGGVGALAAVQLDPEAVAADPTLAARGATAARNAGVITRAIAGGGFQASPPLTITKDQLAELAAGFRAGLDAIA